MRVYCIFDDTSKSIVNVFTSLNDETAERCFLMLISGWQDTIFTRFPEQFSVRYVGDIMSREEASDLSGFREDNPYDVFFVSPLDVYDSTHILGVPFICKGSEIPRSILESEREKSLALSTVRKESEVVSHNE